MAIYQEIWDADQAGNGVKPVLNAGDGDGRKLFNNYTLSQTLPEVQTAPPMQVALRLQGLS